jgi:hypothetical protein
MVNSIRWTLPYIPIKPLNTKNKKNNQFDFERELEMKLPLLISFLCFGCFSTINCAKILAVLPTSSKSHWILAQPLLNELAKSGHEV